MNDELYHYGVKGMKWGVRKNPSKAFRKASVKAERLRNESNRAYSESRRAEVNADKARNRYTKAKYRSDVGSLLSPSAKKLDNLEERSALATYTAAKKQYESFVTSRKYNNWRRSMSEAFSDVKVSEITREDLQIGRNYVDMLIRD